MDACGLSTIPLRMRPLAMLAAAALASLALASASSARSMALPNPCTILASSHPQSLTAKAAATASPGQAQDLRLGKVRAGDLRRDGRDDLGLPLLTTRTWAAPAACGSSARRIRRASAEPPPSPSGRAPGTTPRSTTSPSARAALRGPLRQRGRAFEARDPRAGGLQAHPLRPRTTVGRLGRNPQYFLHGYVQPLSRRDNRRRE